MLTMLKGKGTSSERAWRSYHVESGTDVKSFAGYFATEFDDLFPVHCVLYLLLDMDLYFKLSAVIGIVMRPASSVLLDAVSEPVFPITEQ